MSIRNNPDLDDVFLKDNGDVNRPPRTAKRKATRSKVDRDLVRRRAFRVLALLADLDAKQRANVLRAAERLNRG